MVRTNALPMLTVAHSLIFSFPFVLLFAGSARAQARLPQATEEEVHSVLALLSAVSDEYEEAFQDGVIARPAEFDEAKTFLKNAEQRLHGVIPQLNGAPNLHGKFAEIAAAIDAHGKGTDIAAKLLALRQKIQKMTGVVEQPDPPAPPSIAHGRELFAQNCVGCHGKRGDGRGPNAAKLKPPPADFTDAKFMRGETPYDFYHVISLGRTRSAMAAWDGVLSAQDRWDLVAYLWTLSPGPGIAQGRRLFEERCATCHGPSGNGSGGSSATAPKQLPDLSQVAALARRTDTEIFKIIGDDVAASHPHAVAHTWQDTERWQTVAYLRLLSLGGPEALEASTGTPPAGDAPSANTMSVTNVVRPKSDKQPR